MTRTKNPSAVALGRLGGKSKSRAKSKASAANGKLGGRPKKKSPDISAGAGPLPKLQRRTQAAKGR